MTAARGHRQLALPFTAKDLWAIVDPAGARPAPWWPQAEHPTRRAVNEAWSLRMKVVEVVARNPATLSPTVATAPPAATWPTAYRDRLRRQLIALRTDATTREARRVALRRMAAWR